MVFVWRPWAVTVLFVAVQLSTASEAKVATIANKSLIFMKLITLFGDICRV
jgi:hypothetical protein